MSSPRLTGIALAIGMSVAPGAPSASPPLVGGGREPAENVGGRGDLRDIPTPPTDSPAGFVRTIVAFRGRVWLGTFNDGFYTIDTPPDGLVEEPNALSQTKHVSAPFRMVNDAIEAQGSLYVAANEGLFVTNDGTSFRRVGEVDSRAVTGVAADGRILYATTTSALWRIRLGNGGPPSAVWWKPAGSRSLQGVVAERNGIWLASEDRGAIHFDGKVFSAFDRLAGLPTSWIVAIAGDDHGGVFAATLRDGALRVDSSGRWSPLEGLPSAWALTVARGEGEVCVGTQEGAACYEEPPVMTAVQTRPLRTLESLPDSRVHALLPVRGGLLVGTQAGIAVYGRGARPKSQ